MNETLFPLAPVEDSADPERPQGGPRLKRANRLQIELRPIDLESLLPEEHSARWVWDVVDQLDLSPLYERIRAIEWHAGQNAIDPKILMALWLYATLEGVGSARALDRLCEEHDAYRWLRGGVTVNYHTLADFRVRHAEYLDAQLTRSVAALMAEGLVTLQLTLRFLLDNVTHQLGVDAAVALLLNAHAQTLDYAASRGFRTAALQHTRLPLGQSYAGRAALERRMVHIPDLRGRKTDLLRSPLFAAEGFIPYYGVPLIAKGQVKEVLEIVHRAPLSPDQEWLDFLEALAGQSAIAIESAQLFDGLQRSNLELIVAYDTTIEGWSRALDLRDKETEGHTQRVTEATLTLARTMGIREAQLVHIRRGALLHDIGKMGVPDGILLKPGPLTDSEWEVMRKHPEYAYDLLSPIAYLQPALDILLYHHEKWDGTGYPRGLVGVEIPLAARIFAVVDMWDALRSQRPYREARPENEVQEY